MNIFLFFLILGVIFLVYKKIKSKKLKNLKLNKFKNKLQSTQTNIERIFLREEEKTFSKKENKNVSISIAKKGSKLKIVELAIKNAKDSLNRKIYESQNNKNFFEEIAQKFNLESNISLIEVYDNSHMQGTNSVGALITYGEDGFIGGFVRTEKWWSVTTSRHINKWLPENGTVKEVPQTYLDNFV